MADSSLRRVKDIGIIVVHGINMGLAFGLPLASLSAFVRSAKDAAPPGLDSTPQAFAVAVGIFSVGEFIGAALTKRGYKFQADRSTESPSHHFSLLLLDLAMLGGAFAYACSESVALTLVARLVMGAASGGINFICRSFINRSTRKDNIIPVMSAIGMAITLSMGGSPAVGSAMAQLVPQRLGVLKIDVYHGPGLVVMAGSALCTLLLLLLGDDVDVHVEQGAGLLAGELPGPGAAGETEITAKTKRQLTVLLGNFFSISFAFTVLEAMASPITMDHLGMDVHHLGVVFIAGMVTACVGFTATLVPKLQAVKERWPKVTEASNRWFVRTVMLLLAVGMLVLVDWQAFTGADLCADYSCSYDPASPCPAANAVACASSPHGCVWNQATCLNCPPTCRNPSKTVTLGQVIVGMALVNTAFVIGRVVVAGMVNEIVHGPKATEMLARLVMTGAAARTLGPIAAMALYEFAGHRTYAVCFAMAALAAAAGAAFTCAFRGRAADAQ